MSYSDVINKLRVSGERLVEEVNDVLQDSSETLAGKTVVIQGSGDTAISACERAQRLGARVVAMSDGAGYIFDRNGINLDVIRDIKYVRRMRLKEYLSAVPSAKYSSGQGLWTIPCDIALPCDRFAGMSLDDAKALAANGCKLVAGTETATTENAADYFRKNGILFFCARVA